MFERIITSDNLRNAWIKARQHARTREVYFDTYAYQVFEEHLESNLAILRYELEQGSYSPMPLRYIAIPKGDKLRKLYFMTPRDAVVVQAIVNLIGPRFESKFSNQSFGNRLNIEENESHDIFQRWQDLYSEYVSSVRSFLNEGLDSWYLITDIENFYPTINKERLRGIIALEVDDLRTMDLISQIIDFEAVDNGGQTETISGISPGTSYSHFFANIYLTEFDQVAVANSVDYARYVDDICLVCESEEHLRNAEHALRNHLQRWQQDFKSEKTERHSVTDWEPLIEHTRKMKYAGRLDFVEALDFEPQQIAAASDAEALLSDLYLTVEEEGDVQRLVKEAGSVIGWLKDLNAPYLRDIIYSLLEAHPLKPSTLRVALSALLKIELPQLSDRFKDYFINTEDEWGYRRINLLQVLPYYKTVSADFKKLLIEDFARDSNYIVRASSYVALKSFAVLGVITLTPNELDRLAELEQSSYCMQRLIDCYSILPEESMWFSLVRFARSGDPQLRLASARSINRAIAAGIVDSRMLETLLPTFVVNGSLDPQSFVYLVYLTARFGSGWMLEQIYENGQQVFSILADVITPIVALEVIEQFVFNDQTGRLYQLSSILESLGFSKIAQRGYDEVAGRSSDPRFRAEAQRQRDAIGPIHEPAGLPEWVLHRDCLRSQYREQRGDQDYVCQKYQCRIGARTGTLEIIAESRILGSSFANVEDWLEYVQALSDEGFVSLVSAGSYDDGDSRKVFCLYEVPAGFKTLAEWLGDENAASFFSFPVIFSVADSLVDILASTAHEGFHYRSIDPLNVLWSPVEGLRLINVGASLGIGSYQCGIEACMDSRVKEEIGETTAVFYLGHMLLQLLTRSCAIKSVSSISPRYGEPVKLQEIIDHPDIIPHFRLVLARMLRQVPEYRYSDLQWLREDLSHIKRFLGMLQREDSTIATELRSAYILFDYVVFRMRIIERNPEHIGLPILARTQKMLAGLSRSLSYLPSQMLSLWPVHTKLRPQSPVFPSSFRVRQLSPESRRLLAVAQGWEEATSGTGTDDDRPTSLTKLCLYFATGIELYACLAASLSSGEGVTDNLSATAKDTFQAIQSEMNGLSDIVLRIRVISGSSEVSDLVVSISNEDLSHLQLILTWTGSLERRHKKFELLNLKSVALFLIFFGFSCEIRVDHRILATTNATIDLGKKTLSRRDEWILLKDLSSCETDIMHLRLFSVSSQTIDEESGDQYEIGGPWSHIPELLRILQRMHPGRRFAGELFDYHFWEAQGHVILTFPQHGELNFERKNVFVSGNLVKTQQSRRPIRVDIVRSAANGRFISSVLAPTRLFSVLPVADRFISPARIARWMKYHRGLRNLITVTIGLGLFPLAIWVFSTFLGWKPPVWLLGLTSFIGGVVGTLLGSSIERFLATLNPEDAKVVE